MSQAAATWYLSLTAYGNWPGKGSKNLPQKSTIIALHHINNIPPRLMAMHASRRIDREDT
ncbi:hypothetical protein [Thermithiobacillus plumbiphilus]|uniref:Transposase n=1 Tax=Thermithiobacillus plumbiphilus TaxID=1729899 RepID=A0ABU9D6V4_9PROT